MIGAAALALLVLAFPPCLWLTARGEPVSRLVGLELLCLVATVELLLLARAAGRPPYVDVALVTAVVSLGGSLVFARFLGRSL